MANKKIINSKGQVFETDVAARISQQFDIAYDVRDTLTVRLMCNLIGCKEDSVRQALLLAMKNAGSKSANVKIRFTADFAKDHLEELVDLAKMLQLENEARIKEVRSHLSPEEQGNGKRIAFQNFAMMLLKSKVSSSVSDNTLNTAMKETGDWYIPDTAVFNLKLDFVGLSSIRSGLSMEKVINIESSVEHNQNNFDPNKGEEGVSYRVITEVGGMRSCPVSDSNKDIMADMLYSILQIYHEKFYGVDGADMEQMLESLKSFCLEYRIHDNSVLEDTRLNETEKKEADNWANRAVTWIESN